MNVVRASYEIMPNLAGSVIIRRTINDLNQNFVTVNDLYYGLGLSINRFAGTAKGDQVGWSLDHSLALTYEVKGV